jgi:hypothetical protein
MGMIMTQDYFLESKKGLNICIREGQEMAESCQIATSVSPPFSQALFLFVISAQADGGPGVVAWSSRYLFS